MRLDARRDDPSHIAAMTQPGSPQNRSDEGEASPNNESLGGSVALLLRLWTYGGPSQPLRGLALEEDREVAELITRIIGENKGTFAERQTEWLSARFSNAFEVLSAATALQQRCLGLRGSGKDQQVLPSILISKARSERDSGVAPGPVGAAPQDMLAKVNSAQVLVCESIYESVKSSSGFRFNAKPVREAGQTGDPEAIYELLWTDESTYQSLRKASGIGLNTVGRYQIQGELGRGAMGVVYKAYDPVIGRSIALKAISIAQNAPDRDDMIERLKQEAKAAGKLDHPNIITIYDVGQEDDIVYLSMQFVEGKTLLTFLTETGVPPLATLISWADQISSAVGFAHAHGVIHRDLKPANLMLTNQGVIKVLDFGIAKQESTALTQTGLVLGTPSYMAPEQVAGKKIDHRADIFALGSVLYELVTREKPFRGDVATILYKIVNEDPVAPSLVNPAVPGAIDAIIRKALTKDPNDRFQTCEAMRNAFLEQAALLKITPAVAGRVEAKVTPPAPVTFSVHLLDDNASSRLSGRWPATGAVLALALVGIGVFAFYDGRPAASLAGMVKRLGTAAHQTLAEAYSKVAKPGSSAGQQPQSVTEDQANKTSNVSGSAAVPAVADKAAPDGQKEQALSGDATAGSTATLLEGPGGSQALSQTSGSDSSKTTEPSAPSTGPAAGDSTHPAATASPLQLVQQNAGDHPLTQDATMQSTQEKKADSEAADSGPDTPQTAVPSTNTLKRRSQPPLNVDGFTRRDVPELLRQSDAAAARGDYRVARYGYDVILRLDPTNSSARAGVRRIQAARQPQ